MTETIKTDLCIIGAGSGGLSVAAGAQQMGADCVLIEKGEMGGDCLNYGCVPSKALIAAGHVAQTMRTAEPFGIANREPNVDFARMQKHVQDVIAAIEPNDSQERFEGFGVNVIRAPAAFIGPTTVEAGGKTIQARRVVIATGSSATAPPIHGLEETGYLTNETIFTLKKSPEHLLIIGGGPIGMELAQAHRRLGCEVTVLEAFTPLSKDDPELTSVVLDRLKNEGVRILSGIEITSVESDGSEVIIQCAKDGKVRAVRGSDLLVAAGRRPNLDGLNLAAAGIDHDQKGIKVGANLKTSNRKVYAIGDCAVHAGDGLSGGYQFTHIAGYHAGVIIKSALFRLPAKVDYSAVPWVTYTDPELANVGLSEQQAKEKHGDKVSVLRWAFDDNDRAQAERATEGLVKIVVVKGKPVGAAIVGAHAGELIQPWIIAITNGIKISQMASFIAPYPTLAEINKRAAGSFYTDTLYSARTRKMVRFLSKFG